MHPPFFTVDHKIGPDIHHHGDEKPIIRRSLPERLRLTPATTGWPPVPIIAGPAEDLSVLVLPSGAVAVPKLRLQVVPPARRTWRDAVGRLLIRTGQRMILENRA